MPPTNWKKIEEIFEKVIELPKAERESVLAEMCGDDVNLRAEVENLIVADAEANDFIESPLLGSTTLANFLPDPLEDSVAPNSIGRRIGSYKLIRELGRGGMGAVFLAQRADDEFRKRVAIKLIKRGMDTDFILRRFRNERQILATLDHPNIARLLDGGTTEDGLPYFVMEFIEGEPIHYYCDSKRLSINQRLELFQNVCSAVGYAHQNKVIHRDLKPGNILMTKNGVPKLLDFGIAKLLDPEMASDTLQPTQTGMRLMTPEYASPEQIKGEDLTPASDIYALGVLLYEILTGKRPYNFTSRAPHDVARIVCEEEPENPAKVILSNNFALSSKSDKEPQSLDVLSRNRQTSPENLRRELGGNLQYILLKALRKNPENRYASAEEFSADIQAYLDGMPISAPANLHNTDERFDSTFLHGESLAVLPFRSIVLTKSLNNFDVNAEDYLSVGLADSLITRLSNLKTIAVRPTSSIVRYSVEDTLDPEIAGRELNVTYILDGRIQHVSNRVRVTAQLVRISNNETVWAAQFDEKSDDILNLQDSISAQVAEALVSKLTGKEREQIEKRGTNNVKAYEAYLRGRYYWHSYTVEGLASALVCFYEAISEDPNFALAYTGVADYYNFLSLFGIMSPEESFPAAKEAAQKAIEIDPNLAEAYTSLGITTFGYDWDYIESEKLFKRALELNPNYVAAHSWYAQLLSLQGKNDLALREMRRAEKISPQSPSLLVSHALTLRNARKFDEALDKIHQALKIQPNYYVALQAHCWVVKYLKNYDEAESACLKGIEQTKRLNITLYAYGYTLAEIGKHAEARKIALELEERKEKQYVPPIYLVLIYTALGDFDLAFKWLDQCLGERDFWYIWLPVDPRFEPLKQDARFESYVQKIKPFTHEVDEIHQSQVETKILPIIQKTDEKINITQDNLKPPPSKNYRWTYALTASLLVILSVWYLVSIKVITYKFDSKTSVSNPTPNSVLTSAKSKAIAILPFKSDGDAADEETLGIGLAESLYKSLGQIKELSVRPAMINLAHEQSPKELGKSFGVAYILHGTLHRVDNKIQISAELVDTDSEKILWAEKFDDDMTDLQNMQVSISEKVLNALTIQLTSAESQRIRKNYTENSEAYQLYLLGRYQMANRNAENLNKAIKTFTKARDLDPKFTLAYAGLADAYSLLNLYQIPPPEDAYQKAKENALKAIELDDNLAESHASLGYILFYNERNRAEAEKELNRAIELNPSYSTAYHWFALMLSAMGRHDEAVVKIKTAMELEPRSAIIRTAAGLVYFYGRNYMEALAESNKVIESDSGFIPAHKTMRVVNEARGNYQEALSAYQKERIFNGATDENNPNWLMITAQVQAVGGKRDEALNSLKLATESEDVKNNPKGFAYEIAIAYALLGETNQTIEWLKKSEEVHGYGFNFTSVDPRFDKVRNDPRFIELMQKLQPKF